MPSPHEPEHPRCDAEAERDIAARMMVTLDGLWFMNVLEALGEEAALAMDLRVFVSQFRLATRTIRARLGLDGRSRADKATVFELMARLHGHRYEILEEPKAVTMRLTECSFFENLKRSGRADHHDCRRLCRALRQPWFAEMEPRTDGRGHVELGLPVGGAACDWTLEHPEA